jgi:hypothetical protein
MLGRPYVQLWSPYAENSGNKDYLKENQWALHAKLLVNLTHYHVVRVTGPPG